MAKPKIFVSHSREDTEFARKLEQHLSALQPDLWTAANDLRAGNFQLQISEALGEAEWFLLVLTRNALASQWVREEVNAAVMLYHQGRMKAPIFVKADDLDFAEIPPLWGVFNIFDATTDYTLALTRIIRLMWLTPAEQTGIGIFVSYRRNDSEGYVGWMSETLISHYGNDKVFVDIGVRPGENFVVKLQSAVRSCKVLLAVIGIHWLVETDEITGMRRLDNKTDWVRVEIATALERNIPVIPVLVQRAKMPNADDLPEDLKNLAQFQAHELTRLHWHDDLAELTAIVDDVIGFQR